MNKSIAFRLTALAAALIACVYAFSQIDEKHQTGPYPTSNDKPSIVLLHDSSKADSDWANAASKLASRFEITLVDITNYLNDSQGVKRLQAKLQELKLQDVRISGTEHGERLVQRYCKSYPDSAKSFILPHSSSDMETLAYLFNSKLCQKS